MQTVRWLGVILVAHAAGLVASARIPAALYAHTKSQARLFLDLVVKFPGEYPPSVLYFEYHDTRSATRVSHHYSRLCADE